MFKKRGIEKKRGRKTGRFQVLIITLSKTKKILV